MSLTHDGGHKNQGNNTSRHSSNEEQYELDETSVLFETDLPTLSSSDSDIRLSDYTDLPSHNLEDKEDSRLAEDESTVTLNIDDSLLGWDSDSGISLEIPDSGISLDGDDSGITLESIDSDPVLDDEDSGITLESIDSGFELDGDDSGITLESIDSDLVLDNEDSSITLESIDSDPLLDNDSGISLDPSFNYPNYHLENTTKRNAISSWIDKELGEDNDKLENSNDEMSLIEIDCDNFNDDDGLLLEDSDLESYHNSSTQKSSDTNHQPKSHHKTFELQGNLRKQLPLLVQAAQLPQAIVETVTASLKGRRSKTHDAILKKACELTPTIALYTDSNSLQINEITDSVNKNSMIFGICYFYDLLGKYEIGLLESLTDLYKNKTAANECLKRLQRFLNEEANSTLALVSELLESELKNNNDQAVTQLLRGMLHPLFLVAESCPPSFGSRFSSLFFGESVPEAWSDLGSTDNFYKREVALLKSMLKKYKSTNNNPLEKLVDRELVLVVQTMQNPEDKLNVIDNFVSDREGISFADLLYICRSMPQGIAWGEINGLSTIFNAEDNNIDCSEDQFEPLDLAIVSKGLDKLTKLEGKENAGKIGVLIRRIVEQSALKEEYKNQVKNDFVTKFSTRYSHLISSQEQ